MSFQNFKTNSYCVGQKHYSGTENNVGEITLNEKTGREINSLVGQCSVCSRKKSVIVSVNKIEAEGFGSIFKDFGRISAKAGKKKQTIQVELQNLPRVLLLQPQQKKQKQLCHLLEVIIFYHTGKGLYLGKFV